MKKLLLASLLVFSNFFLLTGASAETFTFSGGCFWCTEADFEKLDGVSDVISGFTGGTTPNRYDVE